MGLQAESLIGDSYNEKRFDILKPSYSEELLKGGIKAIMNVDIEKGIIYFVRHGESIGNVQRKNLSPEEDVLTEKGKLQAQLLGKHLKDISFDKVIASPYARTFETAQLILAESAATTSNVEIEKDSDIREKYLGKYEGGSLHEMLQELSSAGGNYFDWVPEGGETQGELETRLEIFLQKIFTLMDMNNEKLNLLVVTHGGVLISLSKYFLAQTDKYRLVKWKPEFFKIPRNAGYTKLAVSAILEPGKPRDLDVLVAHGTEHLESVGNDTYGSYLMEETSVSTFKGCVQQ